MSQNLAVGEHRRKRFEQEALPHLNAIYWAALRLTRNSNDASDLLQETMLRVFVSSISSPPVPIAEPC